MKEILNIIQQLSRKYGNLRVIQDFIEIASIDIVAPFMNRQTRRASLCEHYTKEELSLMQKLFFLISKEIEKHPRDVLGDIYMQLNIANKQMGQCFTPRSIGHLTARMILPSVDTIQQEIQQSGFYRFYEPSCGSGMLCIEFALYFRKLGFHYQHELVIYAQDLDIKGVLMTHLQLSLLGIPALVAHGDTLTRDVLSVYGTPFYFLQRSSFYKGNENG